MSVKADVILLGGASGTGKSSIAYELGKILNMNIVQVDDFQCLVEEATKEGDCFFETLVNCGAVDYGKTMKKFIYKKVDAFTSGSSLGNPAAFIETGKEPLSEDIMQKIAKEHQGFVSEVVYVTQSHADIKLIYYSSECEVAFCGHGTIAAMHEIIGSNPVLMEQEVVKVQTNKKGEISVYNKINTENAVYITAPEAVWIPVDVTRLELSHALDIAESKLSAEFPVECIDAGLRTLIVPVKDLQTEITIMPDITVLKEFCLSKGIDIILIFSLETADKKHFAHTRVFAPKYGYLEDPATGSGNSAFANYARKNLHWTTEAISVEQGNSFMVYNEVKLRYENGTILFGGQASKKIDGVYCIKE